MFLHSSRSSFLETKEIKDEIKPSLYYHRLFALRFFFFHTFHQILIFLTCFVILFRFGPKIPRVTCELGHLHCANHYSCSSVGRGYRLLWLRGYKINRWINSHHKKMTTLAVRHAETSGVRCGTEILSQSLVSTDIFLVLRRAKESQEIKNDFLKKHTPIFSMYLIC